MEPQIKLSIKVQPIQQFRFRYENELKHGTLAGTEPNTIPTVCLHNFNGNAVIACRLYQKSKLPHSHTIVVSDGDKFAKEEPYIVNVSQSNGYEASFKGMIILREKISGESNRNVEDQLFKKLKSKAEFESGQQLTPAQRNEVQRKAKELLASKMDLNQVVLCFQAYKRENDRWVQLGESIYSNPISDTSMFRFYLFCLTIRLIGPLLLFLHFRKCKARSIEDFRTEKSNFW